VNQESFKSQTSILDRLIDNDPGVSREPVQNRLADFRQLMASVRRELENLLNTKNFVSQLASNYQELQRSLYVYGLPDFTSHSPGSQAMRGKLLQAVETTIALFEPRITNVRVSAEEGEHRSLGFKISGLLMVDPAPEPVSFDTRFDISRSEYKIL
jgi:type VI secretion system protein ImpF